MKAGDLESHREIQNCKKLQKMVLLFSENREVDGVQKSLSLSLYLRRFGTMRVMTIFNLKVTATFSARRALWKAINIIWIFWLRSVCPITGMGPHIIFMYPLSDHVSSLMSPFTIYSYFLFLAQYCFFYSIFVFFVR